MMRNRNFSQRMQGGADMPATTKSSRASKSKTATRIFRGLVLASVCGAVVVMGANTTGSGPTDPGVRGGKAGAGGLIAGMTSDQTTQYPGYKSVFFEVNNQATNPVGLGPGYDADGCNVCHAQP